MISTRAAFVIVVLAIGLLIGFVVSAAQAEAATSMPACVLAKERAALDAVLDAHHETALAHRVIAGGRIVWVLYGSHHGSFTIVQVSTVPMAPICVIQAGHSLALIQALGWRM